MNARLSMWLSASPLAEPIYRVHRWVYLRSAGRLGGRVLHNDVLLLTTRGRRSGRLWTWPLLWFEAGTGFCVVASNGGSDHHPGWYHNLCAEPAAAVQVGRRVYPVTAREAVGAERDRLWKTAAARYPGYDAYQANTARTIPVMVLER